MPDITPDFYLIKCVILLLAPSHTYYTVASTIDILSYIAEHFIHSISIPTCLENLSLR